MLLNLNIKNYALIDNLNINFSDSFTAISGDTGSGKIYNFRCNFNIVRSSSR